MPDLPNLENKVFEYFKYLYLNGNVPSHNPFSPLGIPRYHFGVVEMGEEVQKISFSQVYGPDTYGTGLC